MVRIPNLLTSFQRVFDKFLTSFRPEFLDFFKNSPSSGFQNLEQKRLKFLDLHFHKSFGKFDLIVLGPIMSMVRLRFRVTSPNFANFAWPNIFMGEELGGLTFCKLTLSRANFFIHQEMWPNNIVWWPNNFDWWPNNFGWWPYNFTQWHKNYFCYHKLINQCWGFS